MYIMCEACIPTPYIISVEHASQLFVLCAFSRLDVIVYEESGLTGKFSIPLRCSLLMLKLDASLQEQRFH